MEAEALVEAVDPEEVAVQEEAVAQEEVAAREEVVVLEEALVPVAPEEAVVEVDQEVRIHFIISVHTCHILIIQRVHAAFIYTNCGSLAIKMRLNKVSQLTRLNNSVLL